MPLAPPARRRPVRHDGRAALGALLVTLAALGTFLAAGAGDGGALRRFVVARHDIAPGQRLERGDLSLAPMRLPVATTARAYGDPRILVGAVALAPIAAGELVQAGSVAAAGDGTRQLSFAVDPARALGGRLQPGERVDVLATFGTGAEASTEVVARRASVVDVGEADGGLGEGGVVVTLAVDDDATARAVAHASVAGEVTLVRATGADDGVAPTVDPPPTTAAVPAPPPAPDPAPPAPAP